MKAYRLQNFTLILGIMISFFLHYFKKPILKLIYRFHQEINFQKLYENWKSNVSQKSDFNAVENYNNNYVKAI